jgi:pimeloyl-ACP methyl ester carboxylesterase
MAARLPQALSRFTIELPRLEGDSPGLPRRVKVTTWGAPLDKARCAVVYAGGAPSSAEEPALHSVGAGRDVYLERGIHLVAIDKPGMGGSAFNRAFEIRRDYPTVVARVTQLLGIRRYGMVGISNGGPWLMAALCARETETARSGVVAAAMVVGVSDVWASGYCSWRHPSGCLEGAFNSLPLAVGGPLIRAGLGCASWLLFGPVGGYQRLAVGPYKGQEAAMLVRKVLEDGGADWGRGFALDAQQGLSPVYARPRHDGDEASGEELSADTAYRRIAVPVALWYGARDSTVPLYTAEWLAERIPSCTRHYLPEAGHGLYADHAEAVLDDLLEKMGVGESLAGADAEPQRGGGAGRCFRFPSL